VVKRVGAVAGDPVPPGVAASGPDVPAGCVVLLGDNPAESADSRQYGCVPADRIIGVVLRHLR
jgi:type IV secretory pathway protease TraF